MGIGNDFQKRRQVDFVLGRFTNEGIGRIATMMDKAEVDMDSCILCTVGI